MRIALRIIWLGVVSSAAACGQKGPLYLPDEPGVVVTPPRGEQTETPAENAPQPSTQPVPEPRVEGGAESDGND
jgi:predicted small lipoprotein YifL